MLSGLYANITINLLIAQILNLYFDLGNKFYLINFLANIRNNTTKENYHLEQNLSKKFYSRTYLFCRFFFNVIYHQMIGGCVLVAFVTSIMAYLDREFDFSIISIIIWLFLFSIYSKNLFSLAMASVMLAYISLTYIKLHFRQINNQLILINKSNTRVNSHKILQQIRKHEFWTNEVKKVDVYWNKILGNNPFNLILFELKYDLTNF